jgi:ribosomal protein S18 acetylase RimI-like enzyme
MQFKKGITEKQINQLIEYTNSDSDISKYTGDLNRFSTREQFDNWMNKERTIYTLVDENENLTGIVWVRESLLPEDKEYTKEFDHQEFGVTFAIRLYEGARGKGLAEDFIKDSIKDFDPQKKVWLDTKADNFRAINLYQKLGYKIVSKPDQANIIIMIS